MRLRICAGITHTPMARLKRLICAAAIWGSFATAVPTITFPINSQVPPVARASLPFSFTFSHSTFTSTLPLTYTLTSAPAWLSLDGASRTLKGTPPASEANTAPIIQITAADSTGSVVMSSTLVVSGNPAPQILIPLKDQIELFGTYSAPSSILLYPSTPFKFSFNPNTFNSGSNHYAVTSENTPLPSFVNFDSATLTFYGQTPDPASLIQPPQIFGLQLISSDVLGFAGVSIPFNIVLEEHKLAFDDSFLTANATVGELFLISLYGTLKLDGKIVGTSNVSSASSQTPDWLIFDKTSLSLRGTPPTGATSYNVSVTVTDVYGDEATAIIYVQVINTTELFTGTDGTLNATIGMPFSHSFSSVFSDATKVIVSATIAPQTSWLSFDPLTLILSGDVPADIQPTSINVTLQATTRSKRSSESKTFVINVVSAMSTSLSSSLATPTSTSLSITMSTISPTSTSQTPTDVAIASSSNGKLSSGALAAAIVVPIIALIVAVLIVLCCCRHRRHSKSERAASPAKSEISGPVLVDVGQISPANLATANFHPALMREVSQGDLAGAGIVNTKRHTTVLKRSQTDTGLHDFVSMTDNRDSQSMGGQGRSFSETALSSLENSWRSTQGSAYPVAGSASNTSSRITRNFSRKAGVTHFARDDSSEFPLRNSRSGLKRLARDDSSEFPARSSRTYSAPFPRTLEKRLSIQQTPEVAYDMENARQRQRSRRRTPNYLDGVLNIGKRRSGIGHGHHDSGSALSSVSGNRRSGGIGHGAQELVRENSWITVGTVDNKGKRPQSTMSAVTESTDVLFAPGSPARQTIRMVENSPVPQASIRDRYDFSSSSQRRPVSRRAAGSTPFFGGSSSLRMNSRATFKNSPNFKLYPDINSSIIVEGTTNENLGTSIMRQLRTPNPQEESSAIPRNVLGITYGDPQKSMGGAYSSPREGTRQLRSFVSEMGSRLSWRLDNSDSESRFRSADHSPESQNYQLQDEEADYYDESAQNEESPKSFRDSRGDIIRYLEDDELPEIGEAGEASVERPSLLATFIRDSQPAHRSLHVPPAAGRVVVGPDRRPVSVDQALPEQKSFAASHFDGVSELHDEDSRRSGGRSNQGSDIENDSFQAFI